MGGTTFWGARSSCFWLQMLVNKRNKRLHSDAEAAGAASSKDLTQKVTFRVGY
jgi:hypothetical protein